MSSQAATTPSPPARKGWAFPLDVDFILLLILLAVSHFPILTPRVRPLNDTLYVFQIFHYFYSDFLLTGDVARWLPYGTYGIPATFDQLVCLSPPCYFVGLVGAAVGVTDALLLLKVALFGEKLLFLIGLYALAGEAYQTRLARDLVCAAAVLTTAWPYNLWWDWRIFYLLPLMIYFLQRFFRQRRPVYFWLTGIAAVAAMLGSLTYFAPLYLFLLFVVAVVLSFEDGRAWRALLAPSWANVLGLLAFSLCAAVYCWQALHCLDNVTLMVVERDPNSGAVPIDNFLTHGLMADAGLLMTLLTGWPAHRDNAHYIGLLPLCGAAWGLFRARSALFWACTTAAVALILLSLGGTTARLIYHFPTMALFRHIGLTYGVVKVLILLAGGFGLDHLVQAISGRGPALRLPLCCVPAVILLACVPLDLWSRSAFDAFWEHCDEGRLTLADYNFVFVSGRFLLHAALAAGLLALLRSEAARRWRVWQAGAAAAVALVLLADVGSFRYLTHWATPRLHGRELRQGYHSTLARPLRFCPSRCEAPTDAAVATELHEYAALRPDFPHPNYAMAYNFLQFDPPSPRFRADQISTGAHDLLQARGVPPKRWPDGGLLSVDGWLRDALGVGGAKVRLTNDVIYLPDDPDGVLEAVRSLPHSSRALALRHPPAEGAPRPSSAGSVEVLGFSANTLTVRARVVDEAGAWLVYADAWHPDWRCTLDGEPATVVEANAAFKAVHLGPGETTVRFAFAGGLRCPLSWALGGLGVVFFLGGAAFGLAVLGGCRP